MSKFKEEIFRERHDVIKAASMVLQVSLSAICPIIILLSVGIWLDEKYGGGNHWFAVAGIIIGIYSAYRSTYLMIRDAFLKNREVKEDEIAKDVDK